MQAPMAVVLVRMTVRATAFDTPRRQVSSW
jgi:hypothetical protein